MLLRARNFDQAIKLAEREAKKYAGHLAGVSYTGYANVYQPFDKPGDGAEVFSAMEQSDLEPNEYLHLHYPPEPADCEAIGREHRWYNKDNEKSACYHCSVITRGRLWETDTSGA